MTGSPQQIAKASILVLLSLFCTASCSDDGVACLNPADDQQHCGWTLTSRDAAAADASAHDDGAQQLLQHRMTGLQKAHQAHQSVAHNRRLAALSALNPFRLSTGFEVTFWGAVPVFGAEESSISFLHRTSFDLHKASHEDGVKLFCATTDGTHRAPMEVHGMEDWPTSWTGLLNSGVDLDNIGSTYLAFKCPWLQERKEDECHEVLLFEGESGTELASQRVCHNAQLASSEASYELAACRTKVWTEPGDVAASGILMLPQWIEHMLLMGVDQFFFYTDDSSTPSYLQAIQPYIESGLGQEIWTDLDSLPDLKKDPYGVHLQYLQLNDCLQRSKHRTKWLMLGWDTDEYVRVGERFLNSSGDANLPLTEVLSWYGKDMNSIQVVHNDFLHSEQPLEDIVLNVTTRVRRPGDGEDHLRRKSIIQPDLVHTTWVHYPTSVLPGTTHMKMDRSELVFNHYRFGTSIDPEWTLERDDSLNWEAPEVQKRLEQRFQKKWPDLAKELTAHVDPPPPDFADHPEWFDEWRMKEEKTRDLMN